MYSNAQAAELYDVINPWAVDTDHYAGLAMAAPSVLDVGCGTGTLLKGVRAAGHQGRLVGVDPDGCALAIARRRQDVDWVQASAAAMGWQGEFALAIMTGHAFQALVSDQDVADSLAAIRRSLQAGGRFAFETRNPVDRAWQRWAVGEPSRVTDPSGRALQMRTAVLQVAGEVVTLEESTCASDGQVLRTDVFALRFLGVEALDQALGRAGLSVQERWGGWGGQPFAHDSATIITTALAR